MDKSKLLYNCLYVIGIIASIIGYHCFSSGIDLLCLVSFGIILHQMLKANTELGERSFFAALGLIIVFLLIEMYFDKKERRKDFLTYGGWKTIAIIDSKSNYKGDNYRLDIHYLSRTNILLRRVDHCLYKEIYNALNIGDTILIVHSNKDVSDFIIKSYFPTHGEIQKYKNGVPYEPKKKQ